MNASTHRLPAARAVVGSKVRFFNPQYLLSEISPFERRSVPSRSRAGGSPRVRLPIGHQVRKRPVAVTRTDRVIFSVAVTRE